MPLTDEQRRHLEARLQEERERVLRLLRHADGTHDEMLSEQSGELSTVPFHLADIGTETYEQEMRGVMGQRATDELRRIDDALRRFYETPERYGVCERTGKEIAFERLDIIPWADTASPADQLAA